MLPQLLNISMFSRINAAAPFSKLMHRASCVDQRRNMRVSLFGDAVDERSELDVPL
jgi:hypothetical protein